MRNVLLYTNSTINPMFLNNVWIDKYFTWLKNVNILFKTSDFNIDWKQNIELLAVNLFPMQYALNSLDSNDYLCGGDGLLTIDNLYYTF
jgi:hypothetical protein